MSIARVRGAPTFDLFDRLGRRGSFLCRGIGIPSGGLYDGAKRRPGRSLSRIDPKPFPRLITTRDRTTWKLPAHSQGQVPVACEPILNRDTPPRRLKPLEALAFADVFPRRGSGGNARGWNEMATHTKLWYLQRLRLLDTLSDQQKRTVEKLTRMSEVKRRQRIYLPGDPSGDPFAGGAEVRLG